jgi:hypothetical protein
LQRYYPGVMVYVEFFSPFTSPTLSVDKDMLPKISHSMLRGQRAFAVLPVEAIHMTCHLIPQFKKLAPDINLASKPDLLEVTNRFYLNIFATHLLFAFAHHWSHST